MSFIFIHENATECLLDILLVHLLYENGTFKRAVERFFQNGLVDTRDWQAGFDLQALIDNGWVLVGEL